LQDLNLAADEVEEDGEVGSDADLDNLEVEVHCEPAAAGQEVHTSGAVLSGPAIQLLITACWTSVKEVSLLIGTLARRLPLPGAGSSSSSAAADSSSQEQQLESSNSSDMLQPQQLAQLGELLLSLLLSMKHNGAVEKSQPGVLWLAEQLLQSPRSDLNSLPAGWLARCLARVQQPGQCRDDIVRRSAGGYYLILNHLDKDVHDHSFNQTLEQPVWYESVIAHGRIAAWFAAYNAAACAALLVLFLFESRVEFCTTSMA
jgi:hypothetical protein